MTVLRVIGWLLIAAALILLGRDLFGWYSTGHWETSSAGKVWYSLAPGSLNLLQAVIERHIWQPLWLVLVAPGLILVLWPRPQRRHRHFGRLR